MTLSLQRTGPEAEVAPLPGTVPPFIRVSRSLSRCVSDDCRA